MVTSKLKKRTSLLSEAHWCAPRKTRTNKHLGRIKWPQQSNGMICTEKLSLLKCSLWKEDNNTNKMNVHEKCCNIQNTIYYFKTLAM